MVVVALESEDSPRVDFEDPLGHVIEEVTVVSHRQHRALVTKGEVGARWGDEWAGGGGD